MIDSTDEGFKYPSDMGEPSNITKNQNSNFISKSDSKIIKHYLCRNCYTFHEIEYKIEKNIKYVILNCKISNNYSLTLSDFMEYKTTNGDIQEYMKCDLDKKCKICFSYCFKCKKNLCEDCYNKHISDYETKMHNIKTFEELNNEIEIMTQENYIKKVMNIPENELLNDKKEKSINNNENNPIVEKNQKSNSYIEKIIYENKENDDKNLYKKKITQKNERCEKELNNYYSKVPFCDLINLILIDKEYFPHYNHYKNINNIYLYLLEKIEIKYTNENQSLKIRLFGKTFIDNNINNCLIKINGQKVEKLKEFYELKSEEKTLKITLYKEKNITDMSEMFNDCDNLLEIIIPEESKWTTENLVKMNKMFNGCKALKSLPSQMSQWDTSKVTDMSYMFSLCENLKALPDISKWKVDNVNNMSNMFNGCKSLMNLPDLSKWEINKVNTINSMFKDCENLFSLPDLSKWKTNNITNMGCLFQNCHKLIRLPDISKWKLNKVTSLSYMFNKCESLESLPDLSEWNIGNAQYLNYIFSDCIKLKTLPDIGKWDTKNVSYMNNMFSNCKALIVIPDISRWKKDKLINKDHMFDGCESLNEIPKF